MGRYGDLINREKVVILFYADWNPDSNDAQLILKDVAVELGESISVVKIDCDKNQELCDALRIKNLPTFMVYKSGQMVFRHSGEITKEEIIDQLN